MMISTIEQIASLTTNIAAAHEEQKDTRKVLKSRAFAIGEQVLSFLLEGWARSLPDWQTANM
jgi:hypothetical protein